MRNPKYQQSSSRETSTARIQSLKLPRCHRRLRLGASLVAGAWLLVLFSRAFAQGTAFTYEGQLQNNGSPASGTYNLQFTLYTNATTVAPVAGPVTTNGVVISNGLFNVTIDFGPAAWNGATNWLQIAVETNKGTTFTSLSPRQRITPTPYAIFAQSVSAAGLAGTVQNSQLASNSITINAGTGLVGGGTVALGGSTTLNNAGVTALTGGDGVLVSASSGSVTLGLGSILALPFTPVGITSGGSLLLYADDNGDFFAGPGSGNETTGNLGGIGNNTAVGESALPAVTTGSYDIAIGLNALYSDTVGYQNTAIGASAMFYNTNGYNNTAEGYAALEGNTKGYNNVANGYGALFFNGIGYDNTANGAFALEFNTNSYNTADGYQALENNTSGAGNTANGDNALENNTSGGGNTAAGYQTMQNNITGYANTADGAGALFFNTNGTSNVAVGGNSLSVNKSGSDNVALGDQALIGCPNGEANIAIGYNAGMSLDGSESYDIDIGNNGAPGENGIIRIGTAGQQTATYLVGNVYTPSGTVQSSSDRNAKEDFAPVNPQQVLAKVATLPVTEWNYKTDEGVEHIGPMAQDFHAAFGLNGGDDKHISVVDEGGVALAAIQGLNQRLEDDAKEKDGEIAKLKQQNDLLAKQVNELASAVKTLERKNEDPK